MLIYSSVLSADIQACQATVEQFDGELHEQRLKQKTADYGFCKCRFEICFTPWESCCLSTNAFARYIQLVVDDASKPLEQREVFEDCMKSVFRPMELKYAVLHTDYSYLNLQELLRVHDKDYPDIALLPRYAETLDFKRKSCSTYPQQRNIDSRYV